MTIESAEPNKDTPLSGEEERERAALIDLLVPAAMLAVAVGAGVGSYLHLGLSAEFAAAIALTLFCLMLVAHVLMRVSDPDPEAAEDRQMVSSPMPNIAAPAKPRRPAASSSPAPHAPVNPQAQSASGAGGATSVKTDNRDQAPSVPPHPEASAISGDLAASIEAARDAEVAAMRSFIEQGVGGPSTGRPASAGDTRHSSSAAPQEPSRATKSTAPQYEPMAAAERAAAPGFTPRAPSPDALQPDLRGADLPRAELATAAASAWDYRPIDQRLPQTHAAPTDRHQSLGSIRPSAFEPPAGSSSARTEAAIAEARRIDNILHRLATQIRSGQAAHTAEQASEPERSQPVPSAHAAAPHRDALAPGFPAADIANALGTHSAPDSDEAGEAQTQQVGAEQESALSDAVDALRATVETMRQPNSGGAAVSAPAARQSSSIGDAAMLRLAAVAEALAAERAQVFLEPILKLSDEEARHFEISVHLTTANGQVLDARVLAEGARGAGLLPLLDALGIRHSAGFALKLERRGRDGAVFSEVAGESLESDSFVSDVADRHAQGIADRLVLTFAQSEVRGLGPAQFTALSRLRQLGFRFAMQNVADLDMDFEALAAVGFEFVKLDATVFLDGLQLAGAHIPASDLTRHFVELGLDVIVGRIDAETVRARVLACGAEFGQGPLFGAPRVIPTAHTVAGGVAA